MLFDLAKIQELAKRPRTIVKVPTPHGDAYVRKPSALEKDAAEEAYVESKDAGEKLSFSACIVAACLCNEQGALIFEDQPNGRKQLSVLDADVIDPLYKAAAPLAGLTKQDAEPLEKNGGASVGDGSSASPQRSASRTRG